MAKKRKRKRRRTQPPQQQQQRPTPATEPAAVVADDAQRSAAARRRGADGPPPPPWGSFPLSELVTLVAIVLIAAGFFVAPPQGTVMLVVGLVLGSLAGLELAVREHFSGFRSHTLVIAGAAAVASSVALWFLADLAPIMGLAGGALIGAGAGYLLARAFRRGSGGSLFRIKP
jgi:hypothetical protein